MAILAIVSSVKSRPLARPRPSTNQLTFSKKLLKHTVSTYSLSVFSSLLQLYTLSVVVLTDVDTVMTFTVAQVLVVLVICIFLCSVVYHTHGVQPS